MKHILPTDTINKILTYLSGKAYSEVAHLINEIKGSAIAVEQTPLPVPVVPATPVVPTEVTTSSEEKPS